MKDTAPIISRALIILAVACSSSAFAEIVIFDGFGDADINNNGVPLESIDVNVGGTPPNGEANTYVPGRLQDLEGDGPANPEVTEVLDKNDIGIRWLQMRGWSGAQGNAPGAGSAKPQLRIVDDSLGAMQETSTGGEFSVAAIDSGYAMSWESRGGGSSAAGFFDKTIELGPEVDDEIKVSFDFRMWRDAPNLNNGVTNGGSPSFNNSPEQGQLRFGIFQDTDNQLGMNNPFAGRQVDGDGVPFADQATQFSPAVWGQEEGLFSGRLFREQEGEDRPEGSLVGAIGDNGWVARVFMGDTVIKNGGAVRIQEELQADSILEGNDVHTIVAPEGMDTDGNPFTPAEFDFFNLEMDKAYNIELSLKRATVENPGDSIFAILTYTDKESGEVYSLGGLEQLENHTNSGEEVEGTGGVQSDAWDYFAIRNASNGAAEFDFILDNFTVELLGSNALTCNPNSRGDVDGNGKVEFADFLIMAGNFGEEVKDHTEGDIDCNGKVEFADFLALSGNFGENVGGAASIPEPTSCLLFGIAGFTLSSLRRRRR